MATITRPMEVLLDLELRPPERRLARAVFDVRDLLVARESGCVESWLAYLGQCLHRDTAGRYPWLAVSPSPQVVEPLAAWLRETRGRAGARTIVDLAAHTWHQAQPTLELVPIPPGVLAQWVDLRQSVHLSMHDPAREPPAVRAWLDACVARIAAAMDTEMDQMILQALGVGPVPADASTEVNAPTSGPGLTLERLREARDLFESRRSLEPHPFAGLSPDWLARHGNHIVQAPDEPEPLDRVRDGSRGALLCETCFDCMTSRVVSADLSGTGLEMAQCVACAEKGEGDG
jgi:hypothetical protein